MTNNDTAFARRTLQRGLDFPYDAPDQWWEGMLGASPPPPVDWAHAAARGVVADLTDRRGIKREFGDLDEDVRKDIVESLAEIIREAQRASTEDEA